MRGAPRDGGRAHPWMLALPPDIAVRYQEDNMSWQCKYGAWGFVNKGTGELIPFSCKSWTCSIHAGGNIRSWMVRVSGVPFAYFGTITLVPADRGEAARKWHRIRRFMSERLGMRTYLRATEVGKRGKHLHHYHMLWEPEVKERSAAEVEGMLTRYCESIGLGFTKVKEVYSKSGAISYVMKYLMKDSGADSFELYGWRRLVASKNVPSRKMVRSLAGLPNPGEWELKKDANIGEGTMAEEMYQSDMFDKMWDAGLLNNSQSNLPEKLLTKKARDVMLGTVEKE